MAAGEKHDSELIDQIVCEVIRRLLERDVAVTDQAAPAADKEIVLAERVVTLAILDERLNGARRVVVGNKAVVTPAARDELSDKGVELVRR